VREIAGGDGGVGSVQGGGGKGEAGCDDGNVSCIAGVAVLCCA
jgi:hypothetical protein